MIRTPQTNLVASDLTDVGEVLAIGTWHLMGRKREFLDKTGNDRLCLLIVASDWSDREIDIERLHLRLQAADLFPEKMPLYDMVYESRFRRLRQQFRKSPRR